MAQRLDNKKWLEIKTRYQMGDAIRAIARDYNISDGTIHHRIKKEIWDQKLSSKLLDIQAKINEIEHIIEPGQMPIVQEKISEILQLQKSVRSFVRAAINLNMKNLKDALDEPDPEKRINMTAKMKATMADLVGVSLADFKPLMTNENPEESKDQQSGVVIYLPDNDRDN